MGHKVWLVSAGSYDSYRIVGAFASRKLAVEFINKKEARSLWKKENSGKEKACWGAVGVIHQPRQAHCVIDYYIQVVPFNSKLRIRYGVDVNRYPDYALIGALHDLKR